jgi:hypothetical protein
VKHYLKINANLELALNNLISKSQIEKMKPGENKANDQPAA